MPGLGSYRKAYRDLARAIAEDTVRFPEGRVNVLIATWPGATGGPWQAAQHIDPEGARLGSLLAALDRQGKISLSSTSVVGEGLGNYVGLQRGTAISWVTRDGRTWRQAVSAPVQEQGEIYAVAPAGSGLVAVGSFGAPDDYIPTVWLSPAR